MTNAEAKELLAHKLRQIIDHWDGTEESKLLGDALAVAVSAIDRVTPKKVKPYEKICPCCGKGEPVPGVYVCGACGSDAVYSDDLAELKFCEDCGQALDWSGATEEETEAEETERFRS